ncbi:single-stranded DNA-binding protein [Halarcobacter anaerophilus]|nr:single-stranded DNA-binding protein [Halarcobacter anaerophilus]
MVGNLTRDIELRYTPGGLALAKSSIATSHKYKTQTGEQKEEVCFLEFTIMGKMGETANQYLRKGSKVLLEGRLVFEQWTAQDGTNRSKHTLRVETMKMLDSKPSSETQQY